MLIGRSWEVKWFNSKESWRTFVWKEMRLNSGGFLYGASPYYHWRVGPLEIRKYL